MISFKSLLFFFSFLVYLMISYSSSAVFFMGERFINRQGNIIECFGDCHVYCPEESIAFEQQQAILDKAVDCGAHIIVEDMAAQYTLLDKNITRLIDTELFESPLDKLSVLCRDSNISCTNVEFRQKSCASLASLPIPACQTLDLFYSAAAQLYQYNDAAFLNTYYWKTLSTVLQGNKSLIHAMQNTTSTLYDYCANMCKYSKDAVNLFDAHFIDARIVHDVYQNRNKPTIFICAGANHIKRIKPLLQKMGYKTQGPIEQKLIVQKNEQDSLAVDSKCALSLPAYFAHYDAQSPYIPNNAIHFKFL